MAALLAPILHHSQPQCTAKFHVAPSAASAYEPGGIFRINKSPAPDSGGHPCSFSGVAYSERGYACQRFRNAQGGERSATALSCVARSGPWPAPRLQVAEKPSSWAYKIEQELLDRNRVGIDDQHTLAETIDRYVASVLSKKARNVRDQAAQLSYWKTQCTVARLCTKCCRGVAFVRHSAHLSVTHNANYRERRARTQSPWPRCRIERSSLRLGKGLTEVNRGVLTFG